MSREGEEYEIELDSGVWMDGYSEVKRLAQYSGV